MTLVFKGSVFLIRRHELTAGIALIFDFTVERRTVGVYVEYGKEDSYLSRRLVEILIIKNFIYAHYRTVCRRIQDVGIIRRNAVKIAEEVGKV